MSTLEEQVSALVAAAGSQTEASQALAAEVSGKMAEIDAKVDSTNSRSVTVYVSVDGSDEEGTGASSSPFKTIKKAIRSTSYDARVVVNLRDATQDNTHVIDSNIEIDRRFVELRGDGQEVFLADSVSTVFSGSSGATLNVSDYGGSCPTFSATSDKILFSAMGEAVVHFGGYGSSVFYLKAGISFKVLRTRYSGNARGVCRVTYSRVRVRDFDVREDPATAEFVTWVPDYAGSVLTNAWQCDFGTNFYDALNETNITTVVNNLKALST